MKKLLSLIVTVFLLGIYANAQTNLYTQDFQDTSTAIKDWVIFSPNHGPDSLNFHWHLSYYSGDDAWYLRAGCYDNGYDFQTEQWAVTPQIVNGDKDQITVVFDNRQRYSPGPALQLFYSTDFDGDSANYQSATWTELTGFAIDEDGGNDDYDFTNATVSFTLDNDTAFYLAFKYTSDDGEGSLFDIDNIVVSAQQSSSDVVMESAFVLYPNPAGDYIIINVNGHNNVTIVNGLGQVVKSVKNSSSTIDVADLPAGYYTVIIDNENGRVAKKFMKR